MSRPRPAGHTALAVCAALFGAIMLAGLVDGDADRSTRLLVTVWGVPALVTAEALWNVRRWAHAATLAQAASFLGALLVIAAFVAVHGGWMNAVALVMIDGMCAFGLQQVLAYVRDSSRVLHASAP